MNVVVQWFQNASANLHKVAALSCGLVVEVESASFSRHLDTFMPIIEHHINSDRYAEVCQSVLNDGSKMNFVLICGSCFEWFECHCQDAYFSL